MAVSSRSSRRPRAATAARASCASMAVIGPTSANLSWSSVIRCRVRALRSCSSQDAEERGAHLRGGALVVGEQLLAGARARVPHAPRQPQQLGTAVRKAVDGVVPDDAQPRLEPAQEAISPSERQVILRREMAVLEQ